MLVTSLTVKTVYNHVSLALGSDIGYFCKTTTTTKPEYGLSLVNNISIFS